MRHRNIVGLLFVASLLALLLSRSGYCQSAGPTVTVLVKDGYSGKPISHFELYVDFEDRTSEMLREALRKVVIRESGGGIRF